MNNDAFGSVDAAAIVRLMRECELPTSPASMSLGPEIPSFLNREANQTSQEPFKSLNCGFELEEDDRMAILASLDACNRSTNQNSTEAIDKNSFQSSGNQHNVVTSSDSEETHAGKLARLRAMATKWRNRHRQRVKAEREQLRLQDRLLSAELEKLKQCQLAATCTSAVTQLKWQALASMELIARLQAECQQQRLRRDIERRQFAMQKLQDMFDAQQLFAMSKSDSGPAEWTPDDVRLYQNFMNDVTPVYTRTDEVLHTSNLVGATPKTSLYDPVWKHDARRRVSFFESTTAFLIPSHYSKASIAMFNGLCQVFQENPRNSILEMVEDRSNTLAVKMGTVFNFEKEEQVIPFTWTSVMHRFVESGRTVLVWRRLVEGDGEFAGVYLDETGWCVLSPTISDSVESTDVRMCIRSVPTQMTPTQEQKSIEEVEAFAKVVVRSSQQHMLKLANLMWQLLLDQH